MIAIQIARIIADFSLFLELTDENLLDLDTSVEMSEILGAHLDRLDKTFLRELVDAFEVIAPEYGGEAQNLVRSLSRDYFLEETLAEDDPARLAELSARRDAEDQQSADEKPPR